MGLSPTVTNGNNAETSGKGHAQQGRTTSWIRPRQHLSAVLSDSQQGASAICGCFATIHEHSPQTTAFGRGHTKRVLGRLAHDALVAPSLFYYNRARVEGAPPIERRATCPAGDDPD